MRCFVFSHTLNSSETELFQVAQVFNCPNPIKLALSVPNNSLRKKINKMIAQSCQVNQQLVQPKGLDCKIIKRVY